MHFRRRQPIDERPQRIRDTAARTCPRHRSGRRVSSRRGRASAARAAATTIRRCVPLMSSAAPPRSPIDKPVDVQDAGIEFDLGVDRARVDAGKRRPADIKNERDVVRHVESAVGSGRGFGKTPQRIDIELGRVQFAIEGSRTVADRPGISEPPFDILLIEREPTSRSSAKRSLAIVDLTARLQAFGRARRLVARGPRARPAAFSDRPIDAGGAVESEALRAVAELAAQIDIRQSRSAEREIVEAPALARRSGRCRAAIGSSCRRRSTHRWRRPPRPASAVAPPRQTLQGNF